RPGKARHARERRPMKILWVKAGGLVPFDQGGRIRSFQILKHLARKHDVTVYTFYRREPADAHTELRGYFSDVVTTPLPLPASRSVGEYAQYARLFLSGRSATMGKYALYPEVRRTLASLVAANPFDAIVCDFIYPAAAIDWTMACPKILFAHNVVFTGSMDWLPNDDGVRYFVEQVLPLIRRELPSATFSAVGRRPSPALSALASEAVRVTGTVDDIRPYLDGAALVVVPLRSGSGTRIKIFEAMAMGKAVLSTTLGAEGLPVTHDENIVLADSPDAFARAAVRLLRSPELRARL